MSEPESPTKRFALHAAPEQVSIRDKDNAAPRVTPPNLGQDPAPNLAPPGMAGIRASGPVAGPSLPPPEPKRFTLGIGGGATREFKGFANPGPDHDLEP